MHYFRKNPVLEGCPPPLIHPIHNVTLDTKSLQKRRPFEAKHLYYINSITIEGSHGRPSFRMTPQNIMERFWGRVL